MYNKMNKHIKMKKWAKVAIKSINRHGKKYPYDVLIKYHFGGHDSRAFVPKYIKARNIDEMQIIIQSRSNTVYGTKDDWINTSYMKLICYRKHL